jgi:pimeloyl-ACP methyl ester carboxylesterase
VQVEEIDFQGAGVQLSGSVLLPDVAGECTGVVLVGGSGRSDRHNDGLFDVIGDHFVRSGVAVLAYDKRGVGGSSGSWAAATVDELAADAASAVAALRSRRGIGGWASWDTVRAAGLRCVLVLGDGRPPI